MDESDVREGELYNWPLRSPPDEGQGAPWWLCAEEMGLREVGDEAEELGVRE